jgi:mono/diheme cytochrome c family protein
MYKLSILGFGLLLGFMLSASLAQENGTRVAAPQGDIARGQDVFEAQCFDCHNADSDVVKTGPGFKGVKNGKLPSGKDATRENVLAVINEGVEEQMPPYADVLSDQEKEDVIAYVLSR